MGPLLTSPQPAPPEWVCAGVGLSTGEESPLEAWEQGGVGLSCAPHSACPPPPHSLGPFSLCCSLCLSLLGTPGQPPWSPWTPWSECYLLWPSLTP